jgi:exopolyphosphatase / guanosine-5'-triphosphate,3'-diphosphate pyrophosphatase
VTTEFLRPDPPSKAQIKALRRYVREQVRDVANRVQWECTPRRVIVTSKTFKQLARLNGAPRGRDGPFARRTLSRTQVAMRCLRVEQAEVSPWALREGIVLEHLAAVRGPGERLTLQPLTFNESVDSATITALPDSRMAPAREPTQRATLRINRAVLRSRMAWRSSGRFVRAARRTPGAMVSPCS